VGEGNIDMGKKIKIQLARDFRKSPTNSERIMWEILRRNNFFGLGFRRQHIIEGFIVDFYCHELKLIIEIDGGVHKSKLKQDLERQKIIENKNIKFFRMASSEVENNLDGVLYKLKIFVNKIRR